MINAGVYKDKASKDKQEEHSEQNAEAEGEGDATPKAQEDKVEQS